MQGFNFDPNAAGSPAFTNFAMNPQTQAMGRGNAMMDLQHEMQRAQMSGASPERMLGYQQQLGGMERDNQNWLAGNRGLQSAMAPRSMINGPGLMRNPQANDFYAQLMAALGMGGVGYGMGAGSLAGRANPMG